MIVGLLHPGEMGAAVGAALRSAGHTVLWASAGRSRATAARADRAGLDDAGSIRRLATRCGLIVSLCPPHAAMEVAEPLTRFAGIYVDANAIAPATARAIAGRVGRYVDGGVIGPPPRAPGTTRLYLSGAEATVVADLFTGSALEALVISDEAGAASAVKMAYAAWTKGTAALLLAIRALARAEGVEETLRAEWTLSLGQLLEQSEAAARSATRKGWRWVGEMSEIAETFTAAGLPDGFHRAAAEIYTRSPPDVAEGDALDRVLAALAKPS